jgi:hypothetical protein
MTDDFQPGPQFRRAVDQRARQLRRRQRFLAAAATAVIAAAVALPLGLTWGSSRTTVKVLTPPSSAPSTTTRAPTTAAPSTTPTSVPFTPATTPPTATVPTTTMPSSTQVITYEPFTAQGAMNAGLHVTKVVAGNCTSAGVAGNSSYRCFSGSNIYDPCFARPGATSGPVLCPANPATAAVTQLNTGSLPASPAGAQQRPWAIQLANGQVCIQVNAAWGGLGPLGCQPSPPGPLADCHTPTQASPWWSADCQTQPASSSPFTAYRVTTAWL